MIRESLIAAALAAAVYFMTGLPETIAQAPQPTVTFNKDVLPVLQKNCQGCHRPGQIAPMSLLTYKDARPWAKAMKNAVVTGTMPPWFADPNYGHFLNERHKFNPNPNATVYYGDQTWEEMHFPSYGLVLDDPSIDPRRVIRSPLQARPPGN